MATRQLLLAGSITVSPQSVVGTTLSSSPLGTVPAGVTQIPFSATPSPKPSSRMGGGSKVLSSPSAFQTISGLGPTDDVTTADTIYVKSDAPIQLQLTMQNLGGGSPVVSVVNVYGTFWIELPPSGYATGLAAQGSANLEVIISGPA